MIYVRYGWASRERAWKSVEVATVTHGFGGFGRARTVYGTSVGPLQNSF